MRNDDAPKSPALEAAELRKLALEADRLQVQIERETIYLSDQQLEVAHASTEAFRNRIVYVGTMSDVANQGIEGRLEMLNRLAPGEPIKLIINSPGGSVISGLALCDRVIELRAAGTRVDTEVRGMAASMAGVLAQVGERRTMSRSSFLMIHEAATGSMGKTSELEDTVEFIKRLQEKLLGFLTGRSNLTVSQVKRKWLRKDWWIDSAEATTLGLVDEVL